MLEKEKIVPFLAKDFGWTVLIFLDLGRFIGVDAFI